MTSPRVTVLMSVYNGEKYLREAIDSILNQTFKDFEFVIVNDGSTDKTGEILKSYDDLRIRIVHNDKNVGLTKSLNKGLEFARGKYVARMDADDVSLPERLRKQVEYLDTHQEFGIVGCSIILMDEGGKVLSTWKVSTDSSEIKNNLSKWNQFGHGSVMFRRECIQKVGAYREEFRLAQDYDLWLRISQKYEMANLGEPLYMRSISVKALSMTRKPEQERYAQLARELSEQRARLGLDVLQTCQEDEVDRLLSRLLSKSVSRVRSEVAREYYNWGRLFYNGDHYMIALCLLLKSLLNSPFRKGTAILILKTLIRLVLPKFLMNLLALVKHHLVSKQANSPRT